MFFIINFLIICQWYVCILFIYPPPPQVAKSVTASLKVISPIPVLSANTCFLCLILYNNPPKQTKKRGHATYKKLIRFSKLSMVNNLWHNMSITLVPDCFALEAISPLPGSVCYTCNTDSLPYHHYPDTSHNKQPVILLELQKNIGSTDLYNH